MRTHFKTTVVVNCLIVLGLLFGSLGPTVEAAPANVERDLHTASVSENAALIPASLEKEDPADDEGPIPVQPAQSSVFGIVEVVGPETVVPGEDITVDVRIYNVGMEPIEKAHLTIEAHKGVVGKLNYPIKEIAVDEVVNIAADVSVAANPGDVLHIPFTIGSGNLAEQSRATWTTVVLQPTAETWVPGPGAGKWRPQRDHIEFDLSKDRSKAISKIDYHPKYENTRLGKGGKRLHEFEVEVSDAEGNIVHEFAEPILVRWYYEEAGADILSPQLLSFVWFNEETEDWEKVPTEVNEEQGYIEGSYYHFSTGGISQNEEVSLPDIDQFSGFSSNLYTGAATHRYNIPLPGFPGSKALSLGLNYNSRRRDDSNRSSFSYIGLGWQWDLPYVQADHWGDPQTLVLGGASYTLEKNKKVNDRWETTEEPWRFAISERGETVIVQTEDGTRYLFERAQNFWHCYLYEALVVKEESIIWVVKTIILPSYDGEGDSTSLYGGSLLGTRIEIEYEQDTRTLDLPFGCGSDRNHVYDARPTEMSFYVNNTKVSGLSVEFEYAENRTDYPSGCDDKQCKVRKDTGIYWHSKNLTDIIVKVNNKVERWYYLDAGMDSGELLLNSIYMFGKDTASIPSSTVTRKEDSIWQTFTYASGRLKTIQHKLGAKATFVYRNHGDGHSVRQLTLNTGLQSAVEQTNFYDSYSWDSKAKGFEYVQVRSNGYGKRSLHYFYNDADDPEGKQGLEWKTILQSNGSGTWSSESSLTFALPPLPSGRSAWDEDARYLRESVTASTWDSGSEQLLSQRVYKYTTNRQEGGQYGNVTGLFDYVYNGTTAVLDRITARHYYPCDFRQTGNACAGTDRFITNSLGQERIMDGGWGSCTQATRYFYDTWEGTGSAPGGSWNSTYSVPPKHGLLTRVEQATTKGGDYCSNFIETNSSVYNQYHQVDEARDALGNLTEYTYDTYIHAYATGVTNALNQTATTSYGDYVFGVPHSITDANNISTSYYYDDFGRLQYSDLPSGLTFNASDPENTADISTETIDYTSTTAPYGIRRQVYTGGTPRFLESAVFFDGLGRVVEQQSPSEESGKIIVTTNHYDLRGNVEKASVPVEKNGTIGTYDGASSSIYTQYSYDGLDRVAQITNPDATTSLACYYANKRAVIDEND
ncbi:MAG: RHS repeat protein, partial [Chloroflexi bacterium]|nr:RHS repeat protein [Chloroflexota bacterium]